MKSVEVIGGRVHLIPPKGILSKMKPVITDKFRGKFRLITNGFEIPSRKMMFEVETIVDDDCGICPLAIEFISELAAKYENVVAKVYNVTYIESPFPINATPAFRINKKIRFAGIPLDPESLSKYFSDVLREAYVVTHPKLEWLINRIKNYAEIYGYRRNPNVTVYLNLLSKLLKNIDEYGYPYCPCRPLKKTPGMSLEQIYELNKDKICPCKYAPIDIKSKGYCLCGLFWSKERVDEYIKKRLEKYGWLIKEIEQIQQALEELKKRVISGRGRVLAESLIHKLQEIYLSLPD